MISIHQEQTPGGLADRVQSLQWRLPPGIHLTLFEHWHGDIKRRIDAHGVDVLRRPDVLSRLANRLTLTGEGSISCLHGEPWHFNKQVSSLIAYTGDTIKTQIVARPTPSFPLGPGGRGPLVVELIPGVPIDIPWPW